MSKVLKAQEAAWIQFASAALSGYLAGGKWDDSAPIKAAAHADTLLAEFVKREKAAAGH